MTTTSLASTSIGSGFTSSLGSLADNAKAKEIERKFSSLVDGIKAGLDTDNSSSSKDLSGVVSSSKVVSDPRLPGDFISSFKIENPTPVDHSSKPVGAAANAGAKGTVDKSSKLYEQALELENYFVKIMLSSMRSTINKSSLSGENDFASKMYDDMMYDELSRSVTKSAGFGLADQVYLQLAGES
jgi:peptidoglycan hydrolase FlgJ